MRSIDVYGVKYKIVYADLAEENNFGYIKFKEKKIYIDKSLKGQELNQTLLHEIGHALFARLGWKQAVPDEVEEIIVEGFAKFFDETFEMKLKK